MVGGATSARAATGSATKAAVGLKVGAGKAAFTPAASLLPLDNFTAVHDDLNVRVLLVESGSRSIALAVLDLTSISAEAVALMRTAITAASGVTAANIMVTVTHCFSAPHVQASSSSAGAAAYVQNIVAATKSAVADAVKNPPVDAEAVRLRHRSFRTSTSTWRQRLHRRRLLARRQRATSLRQGACTSPASTTSTVRNPDRRPDQLQRVQSLRDAGTRSAADAHPAADHRRPRRRGRRARR
ncbi:hypothetical protein ACRAWF_29970 [Streptomyces sp. L7]